MRWKALRRRYSIVAPRVIVRSRLPWPLRWAMVALALGFSAAISLWAFEFGRSIAGLDRGSKEELARLRAEVSQLRAEREKAEGVANSAESLLRMEKVAQERLAQQIKQMEAENSALQADLGFFERLLPAPGGEGIAVRGLQVEPVVAGLMRFQLLLMQPGKSPPEFEGRATLLLTGLREGQPWQQPVAGGARTLRLKQYLRLEGQFEVPPGVLVKAVQVSVADATGKVRTTQILKLPEQ